MAEEEIEDIKKLSPEERIRKLKELAKKDEEEISKAQELIKHSEAEIEAAEKEKRQIPIPQLKAVDVSTLFGKGTEEERLFRTKRFEKAEKDAAEEEAPAEEEKAGEEALEARIEVERNHLRREAEEVQLYQSRLPEERRQYVSILRQELEEGAATNIYSVVKEAYSEAQEKGYVSSEQMAKVSAASQAALTKMDEIER